jgi:protein TonB
VQQRSVISGQTGGDGADIAAASWMRLGALRPKRVPEQAPEPGGAAVVAVGRLAMPAVSAGQRRRRVAFKVAAVMSVLLHGGSIFAFLHWRGGLDAGAIETPSEAISVEIVASQTLESLKAQQSPEPAPSPEATAPTEGKTEAAEAEAPKAEREPDPEPEIVVPEPQLVPPDPPQELSRAIKEDTPTKSEAPPLPKEGPSVVVPEPPKSEEVEREAPPKQPPHKQVERKKAAERAPKGGTISKAQTGKGTGGERASASTGSILTYAAQVRARVAANKPTGGGLRGTAFVSFGLTTSGGLAFASVSRSSGNATLDQLAVSAVRRSAPFPSPPAGATSAQLRFSIPFYFE